MDPYILLALITSISSLVVSMLTHIKHSKCWNCEIETRDNVQHIEDRRPLLNSEPETEDVIIVPRSRSSSRGVTFEDKKIQA